MREQIKKGVCEMNKIISTSFTIRRASLKKNGAWISKEGEITYCNVLVHKYAALAICQKKGYPINNPERYLEEKGYIKMSDDAAMLDITKTKVTYKQKERIYDYMQTQGLGTIRMFNTSLTALGLFALN